MHPLSDSQLCTCISKEFMSGEIPGRRSAYRKFENLDLKHQTPWGCAKLEETKVANPELADGSPIIADRPGRDCNTRCLSTFE